MNEVKIVTSDSKIWNLQQTTFAILEAVKKGPVQLNLLYEGPCCETSGINQLLSQISTLHQLPADYFTIYTSNQLNSSPWPQVRCTFVELAMAQAAAAKSAAVPLLEKKFGIFIGRSNAQRLGLASYLYKHLKDTLEITFHYDHNNDYHQSNFGLEEFVQTTWEQRHQAFEFLDSLPIQYDTQSYPILWNEQAFNLEPAYSKIFCEVICETYTTGKSFFMTEKTMRCIANKRPFIIQGPRHFLTNLQKLGFKTFSTWWDEAYDTDPEGARYQGLIGNINWIGEQSTATIQSWFKDMQQVLDHNVLVLQQLTDQTILKTDFIYD